MYTILFFIWFCTIPNIHYSMNLNSTEPKYKWLEYNDLFDCIVGISADGQPIGVGVFVSTRTVLTSANPLQEYLGKSNTTALKVHTIANAYNESSARDVESLAGNQSFRKDFWVTMGYDQKSHTSIHDILLINVAEKDKILLRPKMPERRISDEELVRRPFPVNLVLSNASILHPGEGYFVGFGYVDSVHISDNNELELSSISITAFTDCDEWIPREWGRFICFENLDNLAGLASGSPLFHSADMNTVIGLGCFELRKAGDSILFFTDLRPYVDNLYGYFKDEEIKKNDTVPIEI